MPEQCVPRSATERLALPSSFVQIESNTILKSRLKDNFKSRLKMASQVASYNGEVCAALRDQAPGAALPLSLDRLKHDL